MKPGFFKRLRIRLTPHQRLRNFEGTERAFERAEKFQQEKKIPPTASKKSILRYGKQFISTFQEEKVPGKNRVTFQIVIGRAEGHHPFELRLEQQWRYTRGENVGSLKLGFSKDSVIVETIQGEEGAHIYMQQFKETTRQTWAEALFERLEKHATVCGFKYVKILRPEQIYYYSFTGRGEKKSPEIQERMKKLYYTIARHLHYRTEGKYLVKKL